MNNMKRLLSILLCLAMVLAVLPMAVSAASTTTLYCAAPSSWTNCNVYWWGSSASNPGWPGEAMTKGADGIWYYAVPSDATNVIFNNKVGDNGVQTTDLAMPTDDKVQWNYDAKEWVTYGSEVEVVETVYYIRGTMNNWGVTDPMTKVDDTNYTLTMDLAAGTYEYKAAIEDWSWSCPSGGNLTLTLDADDTVTFNLDLAANSLTYTLGSGTVVEVEYFLRGTMNEWATNDKMVKQDDGTYAITLSLAAGTYEYKAATADWSFSVPGGDNAVLTLAEAADVTFVLDLAAGTLTNNAPTGGEPVDPEPEPDPDPVETVYYLRGEMNSWGLDNPFTNNGDGIYTVTISLAAGTYQYKAAIEDWTWAVPEGDNLTLTLAEAADVTFTLNTNDYTLTNDAPVVEEPAPEYDYYVAGSDTLCSEFWNPAADKMTLGEDGLYTITFQNIAAGTHEYKIATGTWEPSYGYGDGNYSVTTEAYLSNVTITWNAETKEANASVEVVVAEEPGAADIKWQITNGTTAESATTDLRLISWVDSLDYESVVFTVTIDGTTQDLACTKVYTSINAAGVAAAAGDIFEGAEYFVTYVIEGIPAENYDSEITVSMTWIDLEGNVTTSDARTIVISSDWA